MLLHGLETSWCDWFENYNKKINKKTPLLLQTQLKFPNIAVFLLLHKKFTYIFSQIQGFVIFICDYFMLFKCFLYDSFKKI